MEARLSPEKERERQWRSLFQGSAFLHGPEDQHPEYVAKERELRDRIGQQFIQGSLTFDQANQLHSQQRAALKAQYESIPAQQSSPQPSAAPRVFRFARPQPSPNFASSVDKKVLATQIRQVVPQNQLGMTVEMLLRQLES
jgi:hypothetical protein